MPPSPFSPTARLELTSSPAERERERRGRERVKAHRNPIRESVRLGVRESEGGGVGSLPSQRASEAAAESR